MRTEKIIKARCLNLALQPEQPDRVKNEIAQFTGVESVNIEKDKLFISYDLTKCQYTKLKSFIAGIVTLKPESIISKLLSSLINFTEQNELEHTQIPCGWGYYVQNLYLSLHKDNQRY